MLDSQPLEFEDHNINNKIWQQIETRWWAKIHLQHSFYVKLTANTHLERLIMIWPCWQLSQWYIWSLNSSSFNRFTIAIQRELTGLHLYFNVNVCYWQIKCFWVWKVDQHSNIFSKKYRLQLVLAQNHLCYNCF